MRHSVVTFRGYCLNYFLFIQVSAYNNSTISKSSYSIVLIIKSKVFTQPIGNNIAKNAILGSTEEKRL